MLGNFCVILKCTDICRQLLAIGDLFKRIPLIVWLPASQRASQPGGLLGCCIVITGKFATCVWAAQMRVAVFSAVEYCVHGRRFTCTWSLNHNIWCSQLYSMGQQKIKSTSSIRRPTSILYIYIYIQLYIAYINMYANRHMAHQSLCPCPYILLSPFISPSLSLFTSMTMSLRLLYVPAVSISFQILHCYELHFMSVFILSVLQPKLSEGKIPRPDPIDQ